METSRSRVISPQHGMESHINSLLCLGLLLFYFVTTTPYWDLTAVASTDPSAGNSNILNQFVAIFLTAAICYQGSKIKGVGDVILQPRYIVIPLFVWFALVSLTADHSLIALKKVALALFICVDAAIFILLPRSDKNFAAILLVATLTMLGFAYFGVLAIPKLAIHQLAEAREPMNAGFWRGHFSHKNNAASMMVLGAFLGLYISSAGYRIWGLVIIALSTFFLFQTGGKTSTAYLPGILLIAWVFERWRSWRVPIVIVGPLCFNILAIGCATSPCISAFVESIGIDPTFTNRTDIWRLALSAISERPITGYGFQGFWQTSELFYSGGKIETWAVEAYNGHNSYIDMVLTTGFPSLILFLFWAFYLPLRDIADAESSNNNPNLSRLYIRLWLYAIYSACLEDVFFESGQFVWFAMLFSLMGFRLQANAVLVGYVPKKMLTIKPL